MDVLFSILGLLFLLAVLAGTTLTLIYMARKLNLLPAKFDGSSAGDGAMDLAQWSNSLVFRFGAVALLTLLLGIPLDRVNDVVVERSDLYLSVLDDIASVWGREQRVSGPALLIPYTEKHIRTETVTDKEGNERSVEKIVFENRIAIALPEIVDMRLKLEEERLQRSIYESVVYRASAGITGHFLLPDINSLSRDVHQIHWQRAWLSLGISDIQAIKTTSALRWNSRSIDFSPGTRITELIRSGFHAPIAIDPAAGRYDFDLELKLNGSGGFFFEPFGKTTVVEMSSDWPHPSFQGSVSPQQRTITDAGFTASWEVPHLARSYPQLWTLGKNDFDVHEFDAGVLLFEPISLYSQVTRAVKYGILFIALTFLMFLIFELGIQRRLHLVQYGIIGLALSLFFLTLLSLSEHIPFLLAYLGASGIIVFMISAYVYASVRSVGGAVTVAALLVALYGILYTLLKLEDASLLAGTFLLLVMLGVIMFLTKNAGQDREEPVSS